MVKTRGCLATLLQPMLLDYKEVRMYIVLAEEEGGWGGGIGGCGNEGGREHHVFFFCRAKPFLLSRKASR